MTTPTVRIVRILPATPDEVFDAWLDPGAISAWMRPGDILDTRAEMDARVGGSFRITMFHPDYYEVHRGEYRAIERASRLVFTWSSPSTHNRDTLVTLEFRAYGASDCELTLVHELLPQDAVELHTVGWKAHLRELFESLIGTSVSAVRAMVITERPDLTGAGMRGEPLTLMFEDISDSTALAEEWGDELWFEVIREHNAFVDRQVRKHRGRIVANRGDGFFAVFKRPRDGVECALSIQREASRYRLGNPDHQIHVRVGLHAGRPREDQANFYGRDVNLAARIADEVARGGQVMVSDTLRSLLSGHAEIRFGEGLDRALKGFSGWQRLFELLEVTDRLSLA